MGFIHRILVFPMVWLKRSKLTDTIMKSLYTLPIFILVLFSNLAVAKNSTHFTCQFTQSIYVDAQGVYEGPTWKSKGFTVDGEWLKLDIGNLNLKLTTNIQKHGIVILRGDESKKGYQFSFENGKFVYVLLMLPLAKTWTVTGNCSQDAT